MTLGVDEDLAAFAVGVSGAFLERRAGGVAAAAVDDNGAELGQHRAEQRELFEVVAGDEGQVVELVIGGEAVAPALMLGGDDETALRQALLAAHL
ncbi:hypothetical protein D3C72_1509930 [compost metagenome]